MTKIVALCMLGGVAFLHLSSAVAQPEPETPPSATASANTSADASALPPRPKGKSTIMGGEISKVDPVRDQLTLRVFGQHQLKILFDERTQLFRDGKQIPLHDLGPVSNASVQTVLDGTSVYALSVHTLSRLPEGEYQGRVLNYDRNTRELTLNAVLSRRPVTFLVPSNTPVGPASQSQFVNQQSRDSDLVKGSLVSVEFESGKQGRGVASQITIQATPGSEVVFNGSIASLDVHAGYMVLTDSLDNQSYQISFDARKLPVIRKLRAGDHLRVSADFDGTGYVARAFTAD